jgi:mannobiose 2-epimerase
MAMFAPDWTPIPNVQLETVWGADRFEDKKLPDITSYGHNIELAWLYSHAEDILKRPAQGWLKRVVPIFEHTFEKGVDWQYGGLFVEGRREGEPTETNKEFWQQAEALVGFLDAFRLTKDEKYLKAFRNLHDFVFTHIINWQQGEWFLMADRQGKVLRDAMGTNWKILYHTLRATCQMVTRLRDICAKRS